MIMATRIENRTTTLYFDPAKHPLDTLKHFDEFTKQFQLRYTVQYPDPPKASLELAVERWKLQTGKTVISIDDYDQLCELWKSRDKVAKLLGMYSSMRMFEDWSAAEPDILKRNDASWEYFLRTMKAYYKPTENKTLKNFKF